MTGYEPLIESLRLPDPDDRHVLAAAIKSSAQVIVTTNLKHFPEAELRHWNVEAKSPDDFVLDQVNIDARIVYSCAREIANSRRNPPDTVDDVLAELERAGLVQSVAGHVPAHTVVCLGVPDGPHQDVVRVGHRPGRPRLGQLVSVRRTSCAVRSRSGTWPISMVTGRSRSTCDRTVLSASPSSASAAQSSTALATV